MSDLKTFLYVLAVPAANILLNIAAQATIKPGASYLDALTSKAFVLAFCVCLTSLLAMVAAYQQGLSLGQGILFMGAVSIVGGSIIAMVKDGKLLAYEELFLLAAIVLLFVYRWAKSSP